METRLLLPIFIISLLLLAGASAWEGFVVAGDSASFVQDGIVAASSVFPEGSQVEITVLRDGRTLRLVVTPSKLEGDREHFLVLAPRAAAALGLSSGTSVRVSATLIDGNSGERNTGERNLSPMLAESSDPDFNMRQLAARELDGVAAGAAFAAVSDVPDHASTGSIKPTHAGSRNIFLQIGSYTTASAMRAAMSGFISMYPLEARAFRIDGRLHYRLLVGPLLGDEIEDAKTRAAALGIRDAFLNGDI